MKNEIYQFLVGCILTLVILLLFAFLTEYYPEFMGVLSYEDGVVENITALLMGISAIFFFILLRNVHHDSVKLIWTLPTVAWLLFCIFVAGEEISWGQRILGLETPDLVAQYNHQQEINLHNLTVGGMSMNSRRLFNLVTFLIAVAAPMIALFTWGRRLIQVTWTPIMPLFYAPICVGSFVYTKYYAFHGANFINEIRELIFSFSIFLFAAHAAFRSQDVFRLKRRLGQGRIDSQQAGTTHA